MEKQEVSKANISKNKSISSVWIIPIIAALIGLWMIFQYVTSRGPEITLILPDASGIEAGKTAIKSKNVKVGVITQVQLSDDYEYIIAKAQIEKTAERMINDETQFWIVEPHIGADGVSGLETILSGSYIELAPGRSDKSKSEFNVLEMPPIAGPDTEGLRIVLTNSKANLLSVGEPVLHHGFVVGRVEKTDFEYENSLASYQLFIYAPFDQLIFQRTQFWLDSGLEVKFGANGLDVKLGSLETLITGGVSFDVAPNIKPGPQITEAMTEYKLYENQEVANESKYSESIQYALLFEESIRGLKQGAPVEFRGVRIGSVDTVPLGIPEEESGMLSSRIPVLINIEVERVSEVFRKTASIKLEESLAMQMNNGLRATLKTGNLLTGALFVDLDFYDDVEAHEVAMFDDYPVFPTVQGGLTELQNQVSHFLTKINDLPLESTVTNLNGLISSIDQTVKDLDVLLADERTRELPETFNNTVAQLETTLADFDGESEVYQQLVDTSHELELVLKELKPLLETLNEKPNALVFGADEEEDPIPVKGGSQ